MNLANKNMQSTQRQFLLYLILGGILTLIEWLCFYVLTFMLGIHYLISSLAVFVAISAQLTFMIGIHYLISSLAVFVAISALGIIVYKKAIFGDSHLSAKREIIAIYTINILGIALNSLVLWLCVEFVGVNAMVGKIIASFLVAFYSFFMRKKFIYKGERK